MATALKSCFPVAAIIGLFFLLIPATAQDQNRALPRRKLAAEIEKIASQFD